MWHLIFHFASMLPFQGSKCRLPISSKKVILLNREKKSTFRILQTTPWYTNSVIQYTNARLMVDGSRLKKWVVFGSITYIDGCCYVLTSPIIYGIWWHRSHCHARHMVYLDLVWLRNQSWSVVIKASFISIHGLVELVLIQG